MIAAAIDRAALEHVLGGARVGLPLDRPHKPKDPASRCEYGLDHQDTLRVDGRIVWQDTVCKPAPTSTPTSQDSP
jgi:hypothetical protein